MPYFWILLEFDLLWQRAISSPCSSITDWWLADHLMQRNGRQVRMYSVYIRNDCEESVPRVLYVSWSVPDGDGRRGMRGRTRGNRKRRERERGKGGRGGGRESERVGWHDGWMGRGQLRVVHCSVNHQLGNLIGFFFGFWFDCLLYDHSCTRTWHMKAGTGCSFSRWSDTFWHAHHPRQPFWTSTGTLEQAIDDLGDFLQVISLTFIFFIFFPFEFHICVQASCVSSVVTGGFALSNRCGSSQREIE